MRHLRQLHSAGYPIPFRVLNNAGDYPGAPGAMPSVMLAKNGAPPVPANGSVIDGGSGLYWLGGNQADRDVLGTVAILVSAPAGDVDVQVNYARSVTRDPDHNPFPH